MAEDHLKVAFKGYHLVGDYRLMVALEGFLLMVIVMGYHLEEDYHPKAAIEGYLVGDCLLKVAFMGYLKVAWVHFVVIEAVQMVV